MVLAFTLLLQPVFAQSGEPVRLERKKVAGVWANVVRIDLNNPRVTLTPVMADPGDDLTFFSLLKWGYSPGAPAQDARLVAAINGTFFDPPTATVICNLVSQGKLLCEGSVGNTLVIDQGNQANLRVTAGSAGRRLNWSQCHFAVSAGPTLLVNSQVALDPWSEGFSDPGLFRQARRSAMGITPDNHLLLVTVNSPVSLRRLAWMMQKLGASQALNLDGGSSTALYYRGRMVSKPGRLLTNLIAVHVKNARPPVEPVQPVPPSEDPPPPQVETPTSPPPVEARLQP